VMILDLAVSGFINARKLSIKMHCLINFIHCLFSGLMNKLRPFDVMLIRHVWYLTIIRKLNVSVTFVDARIKTMVAIRVS
jgi:hypothetical protein